MRVGQVRVPDKYGDELFEREARSKFVLLPATTDAPLLPLEVALGAHAGSEVGRQVLRVDDQGVGTAGRGRTVGPFGDVEFPRPVTPLAPDGGLSG